MSLWDRFFAPGDLRARHKALAPPPQLRHKATQTETQPLSIKPSSTSAALERIDPARRRRRQNALFLGGLGFMLFGAFVTRKSLARKRMPFPKTFSPSNAPPPKAEGGLDAIEALSLATVWSVSAFMTGIGAGAIYFDIADTEDLREKVRKGVGFDVYGGSSEADKELEEWVADVLSRKNGVGEMKSEIIEKLMEMEKREKGREAQNQVEDWKR